MTLDAKALALDWVRYLETSDDALLEKVFADDHHDHVSGQRGREIYRTVQNWYDASFAEREFEVHGVTTDDDGLVVVWLSAHGRHIGNAFPMLRAAGEPAGKRVTWTQTHIFRARDGRLAEHWAVRDDRGLLGQLSH